MKIGIWCLFGAWCLNFGAFGCASSPQQENPKPRIPNPNDQIEKIQSLIKQLGDNKPQVREDATNELILIGKPAIPYVEQALTIKDAEVKWRAKMILRVNEIQGRIKFSEGLLKEFPNIYQDLATDDANKKFFILQKITEMENKKPIHNNVTENDIAGVIGEVLLDGGKELSSGQKLTICAISAGVNNCSASTHTLIIFLYLEEGWHSKVKGAVLHIIKLLNDEDSTIRNWTIYALGRIGEAEAIPAIKKLIKDDNEAVRKEAVITLCKLGAKETIPDVKLLLKDEDERVRRSATDALRHLDVSEEEINKLKEQK